MHIKCGKGNKFYLCQKTTAAIPRGFFEAKNAMIFCCGK
jgi:hypothetical protein